MDLHIQSRPDGKYLHTFPLSQGTCSSSEWKLVAHLAIQAAFKGCTEESDVAFDPATGLVTGCITSPKMLDEQALKVAEEDLMKIVLENLEFAKSLDRIALAIAGWRKAQ